MKKYIYSKSFTILTHFFLLVLFAVLPFLFSDKLIETETTFRFLLSGLALSVIFISLMILSVRGTEIELPSVLSNHFYKILLLYILFLGFTITHSLNKGEAIYDYLKACTIISYFFLFILFYKNKEGFLPLLLKYTNGSVWIFTLITLSQIGLQLRTTNTVKVDYMLSSSLGNKNFYAETMTLMLPLVLMGLVILRGRWRYISAMNAILILITLVALQTLSTWIAIAVFILFAVCMISCVGRKNKWSFQILQGRKKIAFILMPVLLLCLSIPLLYHANQFDLIQKRVDKMSEYLHADRGYTHEDTYHTNSVAERIFLWKNAWHMFRDYPIAGAGLDNWKVYNTKYELPFSRYIMNNNVRYVRPHNDLLLILAEGGIIGFALYIGLFVYAFILFFSLVSRPASRDSSLFWILAASGLLMYLIIACVSLPGDRFYTQILLFLFFAIICAEYELQNISITISPNRNILLAICLIAVLSGCATSYVASRRYAAEIHLIYALQAQNKKDWQKMGYHAGMAKNFFFPIDYTATPIAWYQGMAAFRSGSPAISRYYFEEALRTNPYDLNAINDLATTIQREGDNKRALQLYDQALDMAPYFADAFMNKAVLLYDIGQRDSAYRYIHSFPSYTFSEDYNRILTIMLRNKAMAAIADTILSRHYLEDEKQLLRMDSIAMKDHIPFEQLVLRDSILIRWKAE